MNKLCNMQPSRIQIIDETFEQYDDSEGWFMINQLSQDERKLLVEDVIRTVIKDVAEVVVN